MATPIEPTRRAALSREQVAWIQVGHTTISAATTRAAIAVFLAAIVSLPAVDVSTAVWSHRGEASEAWRRLAQLPARVAEAATPVTSPGAWSRIVAANRAALELLRAFDNALDDASVVGGAMRAPAQYAISVWLGAGNEQVYLGRDGWLFYGPDVEHVTGPGFLDASEMARRRTDAEEWTTPPQPDPRPAITKFHRDLMARAIALIVVPTPVKPTLGPGGPPGRASLIENASYSDFVADLRREGVLVLDLAPVLAESLGAGPAYLRTDTHWRPDTMEVAAERLGSFIERRVALPRVPSPGYRVQAVEMAQHGDLVQMLDLPGRQSAYPPERVWLRRVLDEGGSPWRPSPGADVLVLGDSFSNIYSARSLGFGDAAGFVEHLSLSLRRPVDRIVQNDEGAHATRVALARQLDRLAPVRVVVYQFATRELSFGDWRILDWPPE